MGMGTWDMAIGSYSTERYGCEEGLQVKSNITCKCWIPYQSYRSATQGNQEEGHPYTCHTHYPGEAEKQNNPQDVLHSGEVHTHDGTKVGLQR